MRRIILLLASVGAALIGLWMVRGGDQDSGEATAGRSAASPSPSEGGAASLASVNGSVDRPLGETSWSIEVVSALGEPVLDADVEARLADEVLTGVGTVAWSKVTPGSWTLTVRAEGYPEWVGGANILPGAHEATRVELRSSLSVQGEVVDAFGRPKAYHEVLFLRPGQALPKTRPEVRRLPVVRADKVGRFKLNLPQAGDWRALVVYGGTVVFDQGRPSRLEHNGPSEAVITIPATGRLLVKVEDPTAGDDQPLYAVSLYRNGRDVPPTTRPTRDTSKDIPDNPDEMSEEQREEFLSDQEREANPFGDPSDPETAVRAAEHERLQRLRAGVRPEGWVMSKSLRLRHDGTAEVPLPPTNEELRMALARGTEPIQVDGSVVVLDGRTMLARILLPPALPEADGPPTELRTAQLLVEAVAEEVPPQEPGIVWR